ncbi:TPA: hypothetical protein N2D99_002350 [Clostridium botulinum]|nr:hypothetical protein [Clostridium botulinum]
MKMVKECLIFLMSLIIILGIFYILGAILATHIGKIIFLTIFGIIFGSVVLAGFITLSEDSGGSNF